MIAFILGLPARLKLWAAAAFGVLMLGLAIFRKGAAVNEANHTAAEAKAEREAHERINNADTGGGLDDGQRIDRLRDFAAKHGNGSAKGKGG